MSMPIAILNTAIITDIGKWDLTPVSMEEAKALVKNEFISAIGHESTATILSELLEVNVPLNRICFCQKVGQKALVFKLNGRPPEGQILTKEEIKNIGFSFFLLTHEQ